MDLLLIRLNGHTPGGRREITAEIRSVYHLVASISRVK